MNLKDMTMEKALTNVLPKYQLTQMSDEIDLRTIIQPLKAEKWTIIVSILIFFALSSIFAILKPPVYQSNVLLEVQDDQNDLGKLSTTLLPLSSDDATATNKQIALIKSRFIIEPVIKNLALDIRIQPHYFPIIGAWYARHHSQSLASPLFGTKYNWGGENLKISQLDVPASEENKKLTLVANGNNSYYVLDENHKKILQGVVGITAANYNPNNPLSIKVDSLQAQKGAQFYVTKIPLEDVINQLSSQLIITELGANAETGDKTGVLQISLTDTNPVTAVNILRAIAATIVQSNMAYKSLEAEKTLEFLNQQLPIIKQSLNDAEYKLNHYLAKRGALDLPTATRLLLTQISSDEAQLAQLNILKAQRLQQYTPSHPFIIQLNDEINALQNEINSLRIRASRLPAADQQATNLSRDVQVKSQLYLLLLNKIQEMQVTKAGTISDVRVLSSAELPEAPLPLAKSVIIMGGIILGFVIGCLIVFTRRMLQQQVDNPVWVEQHFGIPNFAIIPYSDQQQVYSKILKTQPKHYLDLLAVTYPHDFSIEALRSLRTTLHFVLQEMPNNIISILGISPNVGKSFIATNIAYILADAGKKVLLIDADMRKGSIHKYFNMKSKAGLSEILSGKLNWTSVLNHSQLNTLDFIATGEYPRNPSELLMRPVFKQMLDELKTQYDIIIIDTVPILNLSDGMIVGSLAGTNLLVLDNATHSEQEIELAFRHMHNSGVKITGTIFNHTTAKSAKYGQGYYYYKYNYSLPSK